MSALKEERGTEEGKKERENKGKRKPLFIGLTFWVKINKQSTQYVRRCKC